MLAASAQAKLKPETVRFWEVVAQCETGGVLGYPLWDWGAQRRHGEGKLYEGGVGFAASTWRLWAGQIYAGKRTVLSIYPHAYLAPKRVQMWVAEWGRRRGGYWGCI